MAESEDVMNKNWMDFKDEMENWWDESIGKQKLQSATASPESKSPTAVRPEKSFIRFHEEDEGDDDALDTSDQMGGELNLDDYQNNTAAGRDSLIRGFVSLFGKDTINVLPRLFISLS